MSVKKLRDEAVSRALGNIRQIEESMGVGYDSLKKIRSELIELASDQSLFPRAHFPVSDSGESVVYRLSEDDDHSIIALSLAFLASKSSATLGRPPVISLVFVVSLGNLAITSPA